MVTTFAFLALISALPFSTALLGHAIRERLTLFIYFSHQAAIGVAMLVEVELGWREHNLRSVEPVYKLRGRLYITVAAMTGEQ